MAKSIGPILTSIGANATVANILAGELFEFLDADSIVRLWATAPSAGAQGVLTGRFTIGPQVISNLFNIPNELIAGAGPDVERQQLAQSTGLRGERLVVAITNTTGAAVLSTVLLSVDDGS